MNDEQRLIKALEEQNAKYRSLIEAKNKEIERQRVAASSALRSATRAWEEADRCWVKWQIGKKRVDELEKLRDRLLADNKRMADNSSMETFFERSERAELEKVIEAMKEEKKGLTEQLQNQVDINTDYLNRIVDCREHRADQKRHYEELLAEKDEKIKHLMVACELLNNDMTRAEARIKTLREENASLKSCLYPNNVQKKSPPRWGL